MPSPPTKLESERFEKIQQKQDQLKGKMNLFIKLGIFSLSVALNSRTLFKAKHNVNFCVTVYSCFLPTWVLTGTKIKFVTGADFNYS